MSDPARDPRWPWVFTAAELQRMTFPDEKPPSGREGQPQHRNGHAREAERDWWMDGDERWNR
jgi:hypothetical protein